MSVDTEKAALVIFNVQDDLTPVLWEGDRVTSYCEWLVALPTELEVPIILFEHKRLGKTMPEIKKYTENC